jgi:hypothetical protein
MCNGIVAVNPRVRASYSLLDSATLSQLEWFDAEMTRMASRRGGVFGVSMKTELLLYVLKKLLFETVPYSTISAQYDLDTLLVFLDAQYGFYIWPSVFLTMQYDDWSFTPRPDVLPGPAKAWEVFYKTHSFVLTLFEKQQFAEDMFDDDDDEDEWIKCYTDSDSDSVVDPEGGDTDVTE